MTDKAQPAVALEVDLAKEQARMQECLAALRAAMRDIEPALQAGDVPMAALALRRSRYCALDLANAFGFAVVNLLAADRANQRKADEMPPEDAADDQ